MASIARQATPVSTRCHESGASSFPIRGTRAARAIWQCSVKALANPSDGFAYAQRARRRRGCRAMTSSPIFAAIVAATDLPVNCRFRGGYADDHEARGKRACACTGVAGL